MKITDEDIMTCADLLRYTTSLIYGINRAIPLLQQYQLFINGVSISNPALLILKRGVYRVKLEKQGIPILKQKLFFQKEKELASKNQSRSN